MGIAPTAPLKPALNAGAEAGADARARLEGVASDVGSGDQRLLYQGLINARFVLINIKAQTPRIMLSPINEVGSAVYTTPRSVYEAGAGPQPLQILAAQQVARRMGPVVTQRNMHANDIGIERIIKPGPTTPPRRTSRQLRRRPATLAKGIANQHRNPQPPQQPMQPHANVAKANDGHANPPQVQLMATRQQHNTHQGILSHTTSIGALGRHKANASTPQPTKINVIKTSSGARQQTHPRAPQQRRINPRGAAHRKDVAIAHRIRRQLASRQSNRLNPSRHTQANSIVIHELHPTTQGKKTAARPSKAKPHQTIANEPMPRPNSSADVEYPPRSETHPNPANPNEVKDKIENLASLLFESLPSDVREARDSLRQNFADILDAKMPEWGLASGEEVARLRTILRQCQERLDKLERRLDNPQQESKP